MVEIHKPGEPVPVLSIEDAGRPEAGRRRYLVRAPSLLDKAQLTRAIAAKGARLVTFPELYDALAEGIGAVLDEGSANRAELLDMVAAFRARADDEVKLYLKPDPEIAALFDTVRPHFGRLAQLEADQGYYFEVLHIEATRRFLLRQENPTQEFERDEIGLLTDAALMEVPELDRMAVGFKVNQLTSLSPGEAKNSGSPSPTTSDPASSTTMTTS